MTPFLSVPSVQPQPPVQTSAVVGVPTQISTMKLPVDAVPATVRPETVYNNTRGSRSPVSPAAINAASSGGSGALLPVIMGVDFRPSVQFSSPFLAQLFAQTPGSQLQAMTEFFVNDNTPRYVADPALMALYSEVKYKPSNAAIPVPDRQAVAAEMRQQQSQIMQQLAEQKVQQMQRQLQPEATAQMSSRQILIQVPPAAGAPASARPSQVASGGQDKPSFQTKPFRSLIQPTGVDAYIASFSRNFANLTVSPDEIRVAL